MKKIDENYFKNSKTTTAPATEIKDIINKDEQVLWQGKPKKNAYILSSIFSMFPIGIIWLLFDGSFIVAMIATGAFAKMPVGVMLGIIAFFAFHLFPVWIWLGHIITANRNYKNLEYAFTNKRIIAINVQGLTGTKKDFSSLPYSKIQAFSVETAGVFDLDSELEIWFSGLGKVKFEFVSQANVSQICKMISDRVL